MATVERFEDLDVWCRARELTRDIYRASNQGAFGRDYGLRDQMRRAAVSIMSNIAEGFESRTQAMFIKYLGRAKASAGELRAQLYVAEDLSYLAAAEAQRLLAATETCSRQLARFMAYLESRPNGPRIQEDVAAYET